MRGMFEDPELEAFLASLHPGRILTGAVAAIRPFGVFVALDDGPAHPSFPGVGFITYPELSWTRFAEATDVVRDGQRVSCRFLGFDTTNLEARLSLRATQPDPFQEFAVTTAVGQETRGRVVELQPFGVFVEVADGVEGLLHRTALPSEHPVELFEAGDEITVAVTGVDRERRRLFLSPGNS